mmetsp:Transcript_5922/g.13030  ORF Transcript_5922/g.13030 Transcript_5922/m.13030 type:complete len:154 (-) Transcript_5922:48-509(-)|eukprot:CAMPEP_0178416270 /NCGR_PEP_ID=MMETSP0689_2-20121128/23977_1 /TAXON_ID=160604 /ORGANISM="Amphidinium massartii, Strain CS-259" /LENGTH=153 /DNA_ID=CAMNT_0020037609 /DNA_START=27 /DNA_END=488 /DNA_ORIENTATION=-
MLATATTQYVSGTSTTSYFSMKTISSSTEAFFLWVPMPEAAAPAPPLPPKQMHMKRQVPKQIRNHAHQGKPHGISVVVVTVVVNMVVVKFVKFDAVVEEEAAEATVVVVAELEFIVGNVTARTSSRRHAAVAAAVAFAMDPPLIAADGPRGAT